MTIKINGFVWLVVGAVIYWLFNGNPTWATVIPFAGIVVFWPLYLIFKAFWWAVGFVVLAFLGFCFAAWVHDLWTGRENRALRKKMRAQMEARRRQPENWDQ